MLYIVLIALGICLSGLPVPASQPTLSAAGHDQGAVFRGRPKVKSDIELAHQQYNHVRTLTTQRYQPEGQQAEAVPLLPPFVPLGAPVARLGTPADKHYLDHIYPTHHFW